MDVAHVAHFCVYFSAGLSSRARRALLVNLQVRWGKFANSALLASLVILTSNRGASRARAVAKVVRLDRRNRYVACPCVMTVPPTHIQHGLKRRGAAPVLVVVLHFQAVPLHVL